ncbi:MAG: DNA polymerase I [Candidatus Desulfofervidaceae bacterium]|nr:DNA polymerase I [Candidatus Desulfofervidaceae bacterium]MDL1970578.1 DNA polymerase I [Candidatus Desulfofervidaceae bacterium]
MSKRLFLIDGSSYIYRAYHALTPLSNSKGFPTHAIYGVTNMLLKILREKKPEYIAIIFDTKGPTFRHKESPTYKANRPQMPEDLAQQIPYIKRIVEALGLPVLEKEGFEADDTIATLCKHFASEDVDIVVVSGDKDLHQLLSSKVIIWDSMRDKVLKEEDIIKKYKLPPVRLKEIMALTGDKIDNIPGVPGVGEKTAIKLLQQFGSLETLLSRLNEVKPERIKKNLIACKEQIRTNLKLVNLDDSVPLKVTLRDLRLGKQDKETLKHLFEEFEFRRLLKELLPYQSLSEAKYYTVLDKRALREMVKRLKKTDAFALRLETHGKDALSAEIVGISFCFQPGKAWYLPLGHFYLGVPPQLSIKEVLNLLKPVLENEEISKVGHNIKYDMLVLRRYDIELKGIAFDTMVAAYTLNPTQTNYSLEELAQIYLKIKKRELKDIVRQGRKEMPFSQVDIDTARDYACEEVDVTLKLEKLFEARLKESSQQRLFREIEMPLIPVLADMEWWGVKIDQEYLKYLSHTFASQLREIERRIFALAGEEFNINSPAQLRYILFEKLGLPPVKKTRGKTGYSTDAEVLNALALIHPLAREVVRYRMLMKLKSGYVDALPQMVSSHTGRIHTFYNQAVTATGRLSSSEPNLQNIPARGEEGRSIRQAFIPETGWLYLAADYSQIELRLLAHFSQDEALLTAFQQGEDIHTRTAAEIFQVSPEFVTPDMRQQAKVINFGIIYGMSPYGLSKELGIEVSVAKKYIDQYFARYPGVKAYIETSLEKAKETGYVETLFKRKRLLPEIKSKNQIMRKAAERIAINTPIQGTAAEIIKIAMIRLWRSLKKEGLKTKMIMQVHDELIFELPPEEEEILIPLVKNTMEQVVSLKVPLEVKVKLGRNWAEVS